MLSQASHASPVKGVSADEEMNGRKVPSQYYTILSDRIDQLKEELMLTKQRMAIGDGHHGKSGGVSEVEQQRMTELVAAAGKAGRDLDAAMDDAGALLKSVKQSIEAAGFERRNLETAATSAHAAQDAVIAATKEAVFRVETTVEDSASSAVRRAEAECRAAAKRAQAACEDAAEKCLAVAHEEVDRVAITRIERAVDDAIKRKESETEAQYGAQRRDLQQKADTMLEAAARRASDLASARAEEASREASEALRKCVAASESRAASNATALKEAARAAEAAARAEAAAIEAKEAKAWLTHQVTGFVRATEEGITALRDQENGSAGRLATKLEDTEARVRACAAGAEERCRAVEAKVHRADGILRRLVEDAGSVESIKTRLGVVEARAETAAAGVAAAASSAAESRANHVELHEALSEMTSHINVLRSTVLGSVNSSTHRRSPHDASPERYGSGNRRDVSAAHDPLRSPAAWAATMPSPPGGWGRIGAEVRTPTATPTADPTTGALTTLPTWVGTPGGTPAGEGGGGGTSGYPLIVQVADIHAKVDAMSSAVEKMVADEKHRAVQAAAVSGVHVRIEQTAAAVQQLHAAVGASLKERPTISAVKALVTQETDGGFLSRAAAAEEAIAAVGRRVSDVEDAQKVMARSHRRIERVVEDMRAATDSRQRAEEAGNLRKIRSEVEGGGGRDDRRSDRKMKGGRRRAVSSDDESEDGQSEGSNGSDGEAGGRRGGRGGRGKGDDLIGSLAGASLSSGLGI